MGAFAPNRWEPDFQCRKSAEQWLLVSADQAFHALGCAVLGESSISSGALERVSNLLELTVEIRATDSASEPRSR